MFNLTFDYNTVWKFADWAENLPETVDFVDYWYNLFLSKTKATIESSPANKINAFFWNRWKNDFEIYVDKYAPITGKSFYPDERNWFAMYMQELVCALQVPSRTIAESYGKECFSSIMAMFPKYHCYGIDYFVGSFVERNGLPQNVEEVIRVNL